MIVANPFDLTGRVAVITGGAGLLGFQHGAAIASAGGIPVLVDIDGQRAEDRATQLAAQFGVDASGIRTDITQQSEVESLLRQILDRHGRSDILINNAANNPTVERDDNTDFSRLEAFRIEQWHADLEVGLTGAFLCSKVLGARMAASGGGVIVNVASDLALIAPDQRIYQRLGLADELQPVKPISYSVAKAGLLGLTRYLATYWADKNVRVNAISPGGIGTNQPHDFVEKLTNLIPLGRMASVEEYRGAILFLCSDASSYMTGANLVIDGGRTCW